MTITILKIEIPATVFIIGEEKKAIFILLHFKRYKIEHTIVQNAVQNVLFDFFAFVKQSAPSSHFALNPATITTRITCL